MLAVGTSCPKNQDPHANAYAATLFSLTKRLIEVDDEKLDRARALLGARTPGATVDAALDEVLALDERRRALLAERHADSGELSDPDERRAAWG